MTHTEIVLGIIVLGIVVLMVLFAGMLLETRFNNHMRDHHERR